MGCDAVAHDAIGGEDEMDSRPKPRIMTKSHGPAFDLTSSVGKKDGR
jgi:hypothetical protein